MLGSITTRLPGDKAGSVREPRTLAELIRWRASSEGGRRAFTFLADGEGDERHLCYGELDRRARAIAGCLSARGLAGERALLLFPPGLDYATAFLGCLYAGVVAVPAYPPTGSRGLPRLAAILDDCAPRIVLTVAQLAATVERLSGSPGDAGASPLPCLVVEEVADGEADGWRDPGAGPESLAFLQYTSGSTSVPKGVMVTQGNLLANQRMIQEAFGTGAGSVVVSWLPLYHDMGLIGGLLHPLFIGARCVLLSPIHFLQRPARWLRAIAAHGATVSGGPSFAYELCARRVTPEEAAGLDLRSWQVAFNGAEPVRAEVLERFAATFAGAGFRRGAFFPCYGLAEATLLVSGGRPNGKEAGQEAGQEEGEATLAGQAVPPPAMTPGSEWPGPAAGSPQAPLVLGVDAGALAAGRVEEVAAVDSGEGGDSEPAAPVERMRRLVSCGLVPSDLDVRVVDPVTSAACPPGWVGEIWVGGASVAAGYWRRSEESAATFGAVIAGGAGVAGVAGITGEPGAFLRTGDLGFLRAGELYVAGRIKDLVIVRGRNLYPQDVEWTVERSHAALRPGCGAAFAVETGGEERLVVVQEVELRAKADLGEVAAAIRQAVAEEHEVQVSTLLLVKPGAVPKTTSGKVQRRACRDLFLRGELAALGEWTEAVVAQTGGERVLPRTEVEERVARIWEEVLGLAPGAVGIGDSFFALGGDSLRGSQLLARLQDATGIEVSLAELFDAPTVEALAARVEGAGCGGGGREGTHCPAGGAGVADAEVLASSELGKTAERAEPIEPADRGRPLPLTSPQRRLWFLDQLQPGNPAYNLAVSVRLGGELDPAALATALTEIARRHEALRTVFRVEAGVPVQLVSPPSADLDLPLVDLAALPDTAPAAAALERAGARLPFDLARGPLLRATLVRLAPREHEMQVVLHHIVSDAWSIGVLLRELAALYASFHRHEPSPLPPLAVQYGDFAVWQERRLATGDAGEAARIAAWRDRLRGSLPITELPADRPRSPVQTFRGAHATRVLPAALAGGLRSLAAAHGASLFMALLAGFQALVHRLTGQDDLIVGTAAANRDRVELEGLIGFFVNTLPLRTGLGGDPPFDVLVGRARETVLAAFAGREVPFERLVDELAPERDLSRAPIVQVMLVLQNAPLAVVPPAGLAMAAREVDNGTARFDLALSLVETGRGLEAVFKYSRDLFDAATIGRLGARFERLLAAAVADPGRRLSALPLLGEAERHQVVVEWNATVTVEPAEPGAGCLHELFEAQVDRAPEAAALVYEGAVLTYGELDRRSSRLANRLRRLGVGPEVLVGVAAERSLELVVALYAVLKAGGAYVPLDPAYPAERLAFMVEQARVPVLLTQRRLLAGLPASSARVLCLDAPGVVMGRRPSLGSTGSDLSGDTAIRGGAGRAAEDEGIASTAGRGRGGDVAGRNGSGDAADPGWTGDVERPRGGALPGNPAYAIFTSGSTGKPKGSLVPHEGIVNRLRWMQRAYALAPGEGVLQKTPASFDVSVWEFFWPLLSGARLVLARPGGHQDSAYLAGLIAAEAVTTLHFVPSMLQVFLEEPRIAGCTSLARVIASGEALPRELVERFFARLGGRLASSFGAGLHNLYGPTEAAVDVTAWTLSAEDDGRAGVPIGRPIENLRIHLLDRDGAPVPVGVPGHLHIGGVGLARGYLGRPDLTAERFVPGPWSGDALGARQLSGDAPGARLYATGDLARLRPDGAIEFLGRLDHQVKIRGFRIELGEIEATLNAHPAVRESVVVAREDGAGAGQGVKGRRLVAYVVSSLSAASPEGERAGGQPASLYPESSKRSGWEPALSAVTTDGSPVADPRSAGGPVEPPAAGTERQKDQVKGAAAAPSAVELRAFLAARLPEHMVPSAFVVLPAFPLSPSGKVDRKALPAPAEEHAEGAERIAPRTALERRLAAMWAEQLGVAEVGAHDDFFALGGDSIQGALFVNRLQRELDAVVYVMALFDHPTVARFAAHLEGSYREPLAAAGWPAGAGAADRSVEEAGNAERVGHAITTDEATEHSPAAVARTVPGGRSSAAGRDFSAAGGDSNTAGREFNTAAGKSEAADLAALAGYLATRFSRPMPEEPQPATKNPPAVFLLSPFRSGSTLLRVMLAGHPRLFAPPELELLGFRTLGERAALFSGRDHFSREGLLRAVMELRGCDAADAAALMAEAEALDEPTPAFYRRLQAWAGGRLLVDKTPRYALDAATLGRSERWFEAPLYVHLVRHPAGTIQSYLEARMDEVYRFPLPPRRQAELVWRRAHENVLDFLAGVPEERQHQVRFEELVRDPRAAMEGLCRFLGLDFDPAMLAPYEGRRMTDGLHGAGRMMGDPKFHTHRRIESVIADRWRADPQATQLGEATWQLAGRLGYERAASHAAPAVEPAAAPAGRPAPAPAARIAPRPLPAGGAERAGSPLSFGQQRLWFLERLQPGSAYNMPAAVRLAGDLDVAALARACAEIERRHEVLRTVFPDDGGRPLQVVRPPRAARASALPVVDLGTLPPAACEVEAARLADAEAHRPFDLATGPLWRAGLLRLGPAEHLFLVSLHHIVGDGWSVGVLTREMAVLYEALRRGAPSPLPELPLQYADFAAWQREHLAGEALDELLRFWKEALAPPLPVLELPVDRPRALVQTHRGARLPLVLPAGLAANLRELGRGEGATLFMTLAAGLQALLCRLTGQEDVLIGTPVAGRNRAELEGLIGVFVNTLVLRADLSGDPGFRALLGRVRRVALQAARHEELPFEKLVEELGVERSLGHSPLFSVLLALQNAPPAELALPGLTLERLEVATRTAKFDLTFDLAERRRDGGLAGAIEYDADLFDGATAARLGRQLASLLAGAVSSSGARLSDLPLLSEPERHELVAEANDTAERFGEEATIFDLFAATARRSPEAVAVTCEGERVRYGELAARAGRLARHLVELGVGPEILVGICAERSPAMVAALLAVLQAGGAYVPLDPTLPAERLAYILADAGVPVLLTERAFLSSLPPHEARLVLLDEEPAEPATKVTPPPRCARPENLAYAIYTSGSTGRPKGVGISHRAVVNYLATMARRPGLREGDVMLAVTTLSFDIAVTELLLPLAVGASVELVRRETVGDAARLAAIIDTAEATAMQATPATFSLLLDGGWQGRPGLKVLCGGEALPRPLAERLLPRVGELWNVYGPTETTVWSTLQPVAPGERQVPIGRPLGNTRVYLVGRHGELVPRGVVGEVAVGGEGLARGYRGRPALTAERFVPDGCSAVAGARLYLTGDLGRRLPDGTLECLGRVDHQVKVRGFRIELGEIESVLLEHPGAVRAVVVAAGQGAARRLVAYVVPAPGAQVGREDLREFLKERLPLPMVPAAVVFLSEMPLLPSGKVDRKSLPDPGHDRPDLAASYVSPQNEKERLIAQVWQEVLGLERVGVHDNFFDLGGHSMLAAEVHGKIRQRLGVDFPLLELFRHPTVNALAGRLRGGEAEAGDLVAAQELARQEADVLRRRRRVLARQRGTA